MTVLITGGTGKTGTRLASALRDRGAEIAIAARAPPATREGRRFDWNDRGSWEAALEGISAAYIVPSLGAKADAMIDFIRCAQGGDCRRIVLLSASLLPAGGPGAGMVHQWLLGADIEWAVLRPSWFMENFSEGPHRATIVEEDAIYSATGQGRVPFISAHDIAAVAVEALVSPHAPNRDLILTGPKAMNYDEAARILGRALGRPVQHIIISTEALVERHIDHGVPPGLAEVLGAMDAMIAGGAENRVTGEVEALTGTQPIPFENFCEATKAAWSK